MQKIKRSSGNLELDWIKDKQRLFNTHLLHYSLWGTTPLSTYQCDNTKPVLLGSQQKSKGATNNSHSSQLVCISHALSPAAVPLAQSTNQKMLLREPRTLPQAVSPSVVVVKTNTCTSLILSSASSWEVG